MLLLACEPAATRSTPAAISGGYEDTTDFAVVGIVDDGGGGECTGSLIAPKLVLTAQHCVAPLATPNIDCETTLFGAPHPADRFYVTTRGMFSFNPSDYHRASEVVIPPGEQRVCGQDVALLVLGEEIPGTEASPIEPRLELVPTSSEAYSAVGYGVTSSAAEGGGTRRRRDQLLVDCVGEGCNSSYVRATEWRGDEGSCQGDSGGPALDTSGRVIGVLSRAAFDCSQPIFALVPAYREWISAEILRASGIPADAGVIEDASTPDAADANELDATALDAGSEADAMPLPDAGGAVSSDATMARMREDEGCGCNTSNGSRTTKPMVLLLALFLLGRIGSNRRTRRRTGSAPSTRG